MDEGPAQQPENEKPSTATAISSIGRRERRGRATMKPTTATARAGAEHDDVAPVEAARA